MCWSILKKFDTTDMFLYNTTLRGENAMNIKTILATFVLSTSIACTFCQAQSFSDNFNRADSTTVGNGWSNTAGNVGGDLVISNNELTCSVTGGDNNNAGIYRPFAFMG